MHASLRDVYKTDNTGITRPRPGRVFLQVTADGREFWMPATFVVKPFLRMSAVLTDSISDAYVVCC